MQPRMKPELLPCSEEYRCPHLREMRIRLQNTKLRVSDRQRLKAEVTDMLATLKLARPQPSVQELRAKIEIDELRATLKEVRARAKKWKAEALVNAVLRRKMKRHTERCAAAWDAGYAAGQKAGPVKSEK